MSYEEKIRGAREAIAEHNRILNITAVDCDEFIGKLQSEGGTSEEAIATCTWEELQQMGLPKLLARRVAGIFRAQNQRNRTY